jgi:hypothetical protein
VNFYGIVAIAHDFIKAVSQCAHYGKTCLNEPVRRRCRLATVSG